MNRTLHFEHPIEQMDIALGSGENLVMWTMRVTVEPPMRLSDLTRAISAGEIAQRFAGENTSWGYQIGATEVVEELDSDDTASFETWVDAFTVAHLRPGGEKDAVKMQDEATLHLQKDIAPFVGRALGRMSSKSHATKLVTKFIHNCS